MKDNLALALSIVALVVSVVVYIRVRQMTKFS